MDLIDFNTDHLTGEVLGNYEILGLVGKQGYSKLYLFRYWTETTKILNFDFIRVFCEEFGGMEL